MAFSQGSDEVGYTRKPAKRRPGGPERIDALEVFARVIAYIPYPRRHTVLYYAW